MTALPVVLAALILGQDAPVGPAQPGPFEGAGSALLDARGPGLEGGGLLSGGLAFETLGEDVYAQLGLLLEVDLGLVGFGIQLPLRLRVVDEDPKNDGDLLGIIREEDWDSAADVMRILRYVYVGERGGPYFARLGALDDVTLGHGTIVHRYRNDVDVNRWRVGLELEGRVPGVGGHVFTGDLTEPYLVAGRAFVRPLELALGPGPFRGLEAGITVAGDASAPRALCYREPGATSGCVAYPEAAMGGGDPTTPVDDQQRPRVRIDQGMAVLGVDVGYRLLDTPVATITPYVDLNQHTGVQEGWGFHAGVLWQAGVPVVLDQLVFDLRTEYRHVAADYRGPYFNGTYDIERYAALRAPATVVGTPTKLGLLCGVDEGPCVGGGPSRDGVFLELLAGLPKYVFVGGEFLDYTGDAADGTFRLSLEIPALQVVKLRAQYFRVGVRDMGDLFAIDERSAVVAAASVPLDYGFSLRAQFIRLWRGDSDGGYRPVDNWQFGLGFALPL